MTLTGIPSTSTQVSEHVTFRIDCSEGKKFVLRIHTLSKSRNETLSELEWLAAIRRKGLIVPEGVMNREGELITEYCHKRLLKYYATLLKWVEGERLDKGALTEEHIRKNGK